MGRNSARAPLSGPPGSTRGCFALALAATLLNGPAQAGKGMQPDAPT